MKTIQEIAARFSLQLPVAYVEFLLSFPAELEHTKLNLGWCQEAISDRYLRKAPESIAELNDDVRAPGVPWIDDDGPWPNHFFVIGDDQCGNYYAIDIRADDAAVFFYDHDEGSFTLEHESLEAFARHLVQKTCDFNESKHERS